MKEILPKKNSGKVKGFLSNALKRTFIAFITFFALATAAKAQNLITVRGVVKDSVGGLPGVTVKVDKPATAMLTDDQGRFQVKATSASKITFSIVGFTSRTVSVANYKAGADGSVFIDLKLASADNAIGEVTVVAFGTQKKASVVSSVVTVKPKELKGPTSNLTTMLAGRVAGMIAYQRSGEPGADNASFFIRGLGSFGAGKQDPLILIDNIESTQNDLARLQPDDIASFSVLKDATAVAVYGARGANGVLLIVTKTGQAGETKFYFRVENSISTNTRNFKFADNITYMNLANEAFLTRDPKAVIPYQQNKIDATAAGANELLYPNNDWIKLLVKDYTLNQRYNFNISGGATKARYYISGTYNVDNGILKTVPLNNFNSNISQKNYSVRSNVDMTLTPTTLLAVKVYGQFDDYTGPVGGGALTFNRAIWSNPVMFPAMYPSSLMPYSKHPLFGNALTNTSALYLNPLAEMVRGYQDFNGSTLQAQAEVKQDLKSITPGLNLNFMSYVRRYADFSISRAYNPFYYTANQQPDGSITLSPLNSGGPISYGLTGTEYLNYSEGQKNVNSMFYAQLQTDYSRTFAQKHQVSGMLIGRMSNYLAGNAGSLQLSLPARNIGISGRANYNYDNRYIAEFNFGYNGSERFAPNNRFGFFPSVALGYLISNEKFFKPLNNVINSMKIRGSYGLAGNDGIGRPEDRFFYLSNVTIGDATYGATFGEDGTYYRPGVSISRYPNNLITWERSKQINAGVDLTIFNDLSMTFEVYKQQRSNILTPRTYIPSTMGLQAAIQANTNKLESRGIDFSMNYNRSFGNSFYIQTRGNFTYATSKVLINDEPTYPGNEYYRTTVGQSASQAYGYIAERLFVDDNEAVNSPRQFGGIPGSGKDATYGRGDIKYRDVNGDGIISDADRVPIGLPTFPEIIYGFGGTIGFKGFDLSAFFQGSARSSFFINPSNITPFAYGVEQGNPNRPQNGLLKVIADSHWSDQNRDSYAFWPRLGPSFVSNNTVNSTWWMRNGAFLRLKNVELGYNFKANLLKRIGLTSCRVYVNGTNLAGLSSFKLWDPEMGGNGLGYPLQRVYNFGINANF